MLRAGFQQEYILKEEIIMCYEGLDFESLVTLKIVLSRALKDEKNIQFKKDIDYEYNRILKAMNR